MERVETLLQKLQEQFTKGDSPAKLLLTVQMLQHELAHLQATAPANGKEVIAVSMPVNANISPANEAPVEKVPEKAVEEEKTVEVLQVDEAEIEAELEEIKRNAAIMQQMSTKSKPQLLFDDQSDDIPTLPPKPVVQKKEINDHIAAEKTSLNDTLKASAPEVSHKLTDAPVKDLKKAIGVNDRFLFINELFRGDEAMYERSIKTINSFSIYPEAEYWIRRELKTKLGWKDSDETVKQFDQLIKRRFA
ncbi:MAG: hypothetical protein V4685_06570 [Bacteroidota bacterium]